MKNANKRKQLPLLICTVLLSLLVGKDVAAANIADIKIEFKNITLNDSGGRTVCPISAVPQRNGSTTNNYCTGPRGYYQYDLACSYAVDFTSNPTITFKATGRNVDYKILDKNLLEPSFMDCAAAQGRTIVCALKAPGTFQYTIVTEGQTDNCLLDPRIIITDESTELGVSQNQKDTGSAKDAAVPD